MPGPAPKPTKLKLVQGNPGRRALNKHEPKFGGAPKCPDWLTPDAKIEWKRVVKELSALDMIRGVDTASLAAYAQAFARWKSAERIVDCEGQTVSEPIVSKSGEVIGYKVRRHPATIVAKDAATQMLRASALFGFDPSSRSRLSVGEGSVADPFEEFMRGMGAEEMNDASETVSNPR